jgi:hypothetical protein
VVATGVSIEGTREVLGTAVGDSESFDFWREFLSGLRARGLTGVHLVISDAHAGLKAAVAQQFTGASWQRCRVHFMRNVGSAVSAKHVPPVMAAVKTIFAHTEPDAVGVQWDQVTDTLAKSFPKVASMMREAKEDVLAFRAFPKAHWQKIWSNNPIERLNKEIKRRADVVEIFPNPAAFLRLATAVVIESHDERQVTRRYVSDISMDELRVIITAKQRAADAPTNVSPLTPELESAYIQHNSLITNQMVHRSELHHSTGRYPGALDRVDSYRVSRCKQYYISPRMCILRRPRSEIYYVSQIQTFETDHFPSRNRQSCSGQLGPNNAGDVGRPRCRCCAVPRACLTAVPGGRCATVSP